MNFIKNINILILLIFILTFNFSHAVDIKKKITDEANNKLDGFANRFADAVGNIIVQNENIKYFVSAPYKHCSWRSLFLRHHVHLSFCGHGHMSAHHQAK